MSGHFRVLAPKSAKEWALANECLRARLSHNNRAKSNGTRRLHGEHARNLICKKSKVKTNNNCQRSGEE